MRRSSKLTAGLVAIVVLSSGGTARSAEPSSASDASSAEDATELAKKLQNPIGDLYSFPFQNNTNFSTGPNKGAQDILNVQPVIPIHINEDWNVITHTILPLIWQPSRGLVCRHRSDHHSELAHRGQQGPDAVGRCPGRWGRENWREAAGQFPSRRLLQRAPARIRFDLAVAYPSYFDFLA
jgi:hypothetical protein